MTMPEQRVTAILEVRKMLVDLCSASLTPRVPMRVRERARDLLRHYPMPCDMGEVRKAWEAHDKPTYANYQDEDEANENLVFTSKRSG